MQGRESSPGAVLGGARKPFFTRLVDRAAGGCSVECFVTVFGPRAVSVYVCVLTLSGRMGTMWEDALYFQWSKPPIIIGGVPLFLVHSPCYRIQSNFHRYWNKTSLRNVLDTWGVFPVVCWLLSKQEIFRYDKPEITSITITTMIIIVTAVTCYVPNNAKKSITILALMTRSTVEVAHFD